MLDLNEDVAEFYNGGDDDDARLPEDMHASIQGEETRKSGECSSNKQFHSNAVEDDGEEEGDDDDDVDCNEHVNELTIPPPAVDMVFDSWEEIDSYYKSYGQQEGFGVVRASSAYKTGSKQRRNVFWTCESYGRADRKRNKCGPSVTDSVVQEQTDLRPGNSKKCECPVSLLASVNKEGKWVVRKAVNDHKNHKPLSPRKTKYIHMYRKGNLTDRVKRQLLNDTSVGISLAQIHSSLAEQYGGVDELGLTQRDLRNYSNVNKRLKMEDGDVEAMLAHFRKMSADNQNFFHMHRLDSEGRLQDIVWVDARSRAAYAEFGDVVCFDATYLTNKYHLPFANFVGVNHHGQSILLGCALISHETTETYEWVFSTWKLCMGKAPDRILTDQCAAMRRALSTVMPESTHRWCLWHITSKFSNKLKYYDRYDDLVKVLTNLIYDSLDISEFESRWTAFIEEFGLGDDSWLAGLYEERHMWVPAYLRHMFWAGMKTTQRVESMNSFFDKYVDKDTRLHEFASRYCRAMEMRTEAELEEDAKSTRRVRQLALGTHIERCFQKYYTDAKFKEAQREIARLTVQNWKKKVMVSEHIAEHTIQDRVWIKPKNSTKEIPTEHRRCYTVTFDSRDNDVRCNCMYFESHGIMCRHMLRVYDVEEVKVVPQKYLLRRWMKDVRRKHTRVKVAYHDPGKTEEVKRFNKLLGDCEDVCFKASFHEENVAIVKEMLQLLDQRIEENNKRLKGESNLEEEGFPSSGNNEGFVFSQTPQSVPNSSTSNSKRQRVASAQGSCPTPSGDTTSQANNFVPTVPKVKDPPVPKKVGRPRTKRLVSEAEKAKEKSKKKKAAQNANGGKGKVGKSTEASNKSNKQRKRNKGSQGTLEVVPEEGPIDEFLFSHHGGSVHRADSMSTLTFPMEFYGWGPERTNDFSGGSAMSNELDLMQRSSICNSGFGFSHRVSAPDPPLNVYGSGASSLYDTGEYLEPLLHEKSHNVASGYSSSIGRFAELNVNLDLRM